MFSGQFMLMQRLQKTNEIRNYMAYIWTGAGILILLLYLKSVHIPNLVQQAPILIMGGIASWAGMYAYNLSVRYQPNLGYIEALSSIRVVIVFFVSIIFLDAEFELYKLLALVGIVIGVTLVTGVQDTGVSQNKLWVLWAIVSGVMFSVLIICSKFVFSSGVISPLVTASILIIAGFIFIISANKSLLDFNFSNDTFVLVLAIACSTIGNLAYFRSFNSAPNLAYAVAISSTRMILLYGMALILGNDKFQKLRTVGVIITFIGVVLLG
jgi:uncharacterized membrane protein